MAARSAKRQRRPAARSGPRPHCSTRMATARRWIECMSDGIIIGIDTGGTFTDVTILDRRSGVMRTAKTPTTPHDPSQGFASAARDALAVLGGMAADVSRVLHGTTVATNLILESKGPPVAMLVTSGFRAMLEIGRQDIPRSGSLFEWVKPKRPVPPRLIWEIPGRIDHNENEIQSL